MEERWYVRFRGRNLGPLTADQVKASVKRKELGPEDRLASVSDPTWRPLRSQEEFFRYWENFAPIPLELTPLPPPTILWKKGRPAGAVRSAERDLSGSVDASELRDSSRLRDSRVPSDLPESSSRTLSLAPVPVRDISAETLPTPIPHATAPVNPSISETHVARQNVPGNTPEPKPVPAPRTSPVPGPANPAASVALAALAKNPATAHPAAPTIAAPFTSVAEAAPQPSLEKKPAPVVAPMPAPVAPAKTIAPAPTPGPVPGPEKSATVPAAAPHATPTPAASSPTSPAATSAPARSAPSPAHRSAAEPTNPIKFTQTAPAPAPAARFVPGSTPGNVPGNTPAPPAAGPLAQPEKTAAPLLAPQPAPAAAPPTQHSAKPLPKVEPEKLSDSYLLVETLREWGQRDSSTAHPVPSRPAMATLPPVTFTPPRPLHPAAAPTEHFSPTPAQYQPTNQHARHSASNQSPHEPQTQLSYEYDHQPNPAHTLAAHASPSPREPEIRLHLTVSKRFIFISVTVALLAFAAIIFTLVNLEKMRGPEDFRLPNPSGPTVEPRAENDPIPQLKAPTRPQRD